MLGVGAPEEITGSDGAYMWCVGVYAIVIAVILGVNSAVPQLGYIFCSLYVVQYFY